ncbi:receptor like protein 22-like [Solanum stenotomum]|uniref:receptor like protein 22-like n=1 Tax=Solanum stenotomum TaxID=172797 RepID=UPI0020D0E5A7|nr:receptor like protein 22-like [Solanum stenotomum]
MSNLTHLQQLDLSSNSLCGPLPHNASNHQKLTQLDLYDNLLNGTIPSWLFSLHLLRSLLSLSRNQFSGLPDELKTNPALIEVDLSNKQLSGSFPQSLVNLTNLETLDLSSNNITGPFPASILSLTHLEYLDLSSNSLSGPLPSNASMLQKLISVDLSYNSLNGTIPSWNLPLLSLLWLHYNQLSGSFPQSLVNLTNLVYLDLSSNNITIAEGINITFPCLEVLQLSSCELKDFPHFLTNVKTLQVLDISNNKICGQIPNWFSSMSFSNSIPSCLGSMANLTVLDLKKEQPHRESSSIMCTEHFIEYHCRKCLARNLEELQVLILKSNKFHGPTSTCQTKFCFPKLRIFDLSCNELSGSLPAKVFRNFKAMIKLDGEDTGEIEYMKLSDTSYEDSVSLVIKGQVIELQRISTIMTTIDLSSNHFEGVIPETLKDLSSLWLLNLSHNNLIGHIPMELGQLNKLEALDLSWNRLTGKIPQELTRMNFLAFLNVSQNHLVGPIPHSLQFNTFENDSYGGNLDLCGPPLSKQCGTSDSSHVPQALESYFFSGFTWESVVIGYSFGLVVETIMWSLMFKYRKPKWLVEFFDGLMPQKRRRPKKRAQRQQT